VKDRVVQFGRGGPKTHRRRRAGLASLVGLVLFSVVFLAQGSLSSAATTKPELNFGLSQGPLSLDPSTGAGTVYTPMLTLEFQPLLAKDYQTGKFIGSLATKWGYIGSGNNTFFVTLRHGARFSDGEPLDANALKTTFDYYGKSAALSAQINLASTETKGDDTVIMHLGAPNPDVPSFLTYNWGYPIAPKGVANPKLISTGYIGGAGAYDIVPGQSVLGSKYVYVPSKFYYDKSKQAYSKITMTVIPSASSMLAALESGQIDAGFGSSGTAPAAGKAGLKVHFAPMGINNVVITDREGKSVPALGDVRVRLAINYAIDRKAVEKSAAGYYGVPTSDYEVGLGYDPSFANYYPYDPEKAKQLLAAAGYPNGFTFSVICWVNPSYGSQAMLPVAQDLAKVGITLKVFQPATSAEYVTARVAAGQYQALQSLTNGAGAGASAIADFESNLGAKAVSNVYKAAVDQHLVDMEAKAAVASPKAAAAIEKAMVRWTLDEGYFIPLYRYGWIWFTNKNIAGVNVTPGYPMPYVPDWHPATS
jgi:peptide/nickel transport system substrate-binding protein